MKIRVQIQPPSPQTPYDHTSVEGGTWVQESSMIVEGGTPIERIVTLQAERGYGIRTMFSIISKYNSGL